MCVNTPKIRKTKDKKVLNLVSSYVMLCLDRSKLPTEYHWPISHLKMTHDNTIPSRRISRRDISRRDIVSPSQVVHTQMLDMKSGCSSIRHQPLSKEEETRLYTQLTHT